MTNSRIKLVPPPPTTPSAPPIETVETLDEKIASLPRSPVTPEDITARATLMAKRIELDQARRASPPRVEQPTGLVLNIPENVSCYEIQHQGRTFRARALPDGRRVIDVTPSLFHALVASAHGQDWANANQGSDVWQKIQPGSYAS
jgi:hypothetical protein